MVLKQVKIIGLTLAAIAIATLIYGSSHIVRTIEGMSPFDLAFAVWLQRLFNPEVTSSALIEYSSASPHLFEWWLRRTLEAAIICLPIAFLLERFRYSKLSEESILKNMEQAIPIALGWWVLTPYHLYLKIYPLPSWFSPQSAQELASHKFMVLTHSVFAFVVFLLAYACLPILVRRFFNKDIVKINDVLVEKKLQPNIPKPNEETAKIVNYIDLEDECKTAEIHRFSKSFFNMLTSFLFGLFVIVILVVLPYIAIVGIDMGDMPKIKIGEIASMISIILVAPFVISAGCAAIFAISRRAFVAVTGGLLIFLVILGAKNFFDYYPTIVQGENSDILQFKMFWIAAVWLTIGMLCLAIIAWDFFKYGLFQTNRDRRKLVTRVKLDFMRHFFGFLNVPRFATVFGPRALLSVLFIWLSLGAVLPLRILPFSLLNPSWFSFSGTPLSIMMQQIHQANNVCKSPVPDNLLTACEVQYVLGTFYVVDGFGFLLMFPIYAGLGFLGIVLANTITRNLSRKYQAQPKRDNREPILYLRPFHTDRSPLKWRTRLLTSHFAIVPGEPRTIDEIVLHECCLDGPIVAIGRPEEAVPPLGAARIYVEGDNWKDVVLGLARSAKYIVIATEPTDGVIWEVEQIIANGWASKTLFILTDNLSDNARELISDRLMGKVNPGSASRFDNRNSKPVALMHGDDDDWNAIHSRFLDRFKLQAIVARFRKFQNEQSEVFP